MSVYIACTGRGLFALIAVALITAPAQVQAGPSGVTWEKRIEVASGNAYRGRWRMNESNFDYVDDPTVAINEQGFVGIAWADQSRQDIFFQIYEPNGNRRFREPVNVSASPRIFSWLPKIVIGPGDAREAYVLWQEIVFSGGSHGGEIFFARTTDDGKAFSVPINLSNSLAGDGKGRLTRRLWHNGSLDLAMGPQDDLYAAWSEYDGRLWFSRSSDGGVSFSDPLRIKGDLRTAPARGPSLAVDAKGAIYLAWAVGEDKAADIRFTKSVNNGRSFDTPRIVFESDGHADAPKIAVDGKGTVHMVYAESPTGPFQRYHVQYTRLNEKRHTFEEPREISGPLADQFDSMSFPALSLDDEDNIYVIWDLFHRRGHYPRGLGFTYSRDGGRTFLSPSIIPGSADRTLGVNGSLQGFLMKKLAVNGTGAIAVVSSTFKNNQRSGIWLFRGHAAGRRPAERRPGDE